MPKKKTYFTARETALQIAVMMKRRELKQAVLPKQLLLDVGSKPGGAHRERLRAGFLRDVQVYLRDKLWLYSIVVADGDLFVVDNIEVRTGTEKLVKGDLTRAEWKGKLDWDRLEAEIFPEPKDDYEDGGTRLR